MPLIAEVETGEVLSVHLDDEAVEGLLGVTADGCQISDSEREAALRVAKPALWPGWQAGW